MPILIELFVSFFLVAFVSFGGASAVIPELYRIAVTEHGWMDARTFTELFAIAQAAPGPNVLFVALMGWNIGLRAGGGLSAGPPAWALGMMGVLITMVGIMLPSSILTYQATQWTHKNRNLRSVRAFKSGMAPIVIGLLVSTGWLLSAAHRDFQQDWKLWLVTAAATVLMLRTNLHLLWMIAIGGVLGGAGLL